VIAAFGKEFAKTNEVPKAFHRFLTRAFELRMDGDYGGVNAVSEANARETLKHAQAFIDLAREKIGPLPQQNGG